MRTHRRHLPSPTRTPVLRDIDLLYLFPGDAPAIELMLLVKALARSDLRPTIHDRTLWMGLGWSERKLRRVKARVREAGIEIVRRKGRHGGLLACRWILDRRRIGALRGHEEQGVVASLAPDIGVQHLQEDDAYRRRPPEGRTASRGPPNKQGHGPEVDPDPTRRDLPTAAALEAVPEAARTLAELRGLAGNSSSDELWGAALAEGRGRLRIRGTPPPLLKLAVMVLVGERAGGDELRAGALLRSIRPTEEGDDP